ncbi:MAG: hypothetical protein LAP85_09060 [Acidobacteriia bacterium]|nr:hypothetical protein [Terriglobia bacterium]
MDVGGSRTVKRETDTQSVAGSNQVAASAAGNFNPEEMRDIVKALRQFLKIARDILRGHLVQAGNRADTLSKLDSLQSIEASFQVWNQVTSQDRLAIENAAPEIVPAESSSSPATGTVSAQA